MKRSTDLFDLLDRRTEELRHLAQRHTTHSWLTKKASRVGGRANKVLLDLIDIHRKAWEI
ncbi:MAG: hypothetical protein ACRCUJ_06860 [Phocaeicola sp.]